MTTVQPLPAAIAQIFDRKRTKGDRERRKKIVNMISIADLVE